MGAEPNRKAGARPACSELAVSRSIPCGDGSAPVEAIVHTRFHRVIVVGGAAERHQRSRGDEAGAAEIVVLVLDLCRPVLGEQVLEAGADRLAIAMAAVQRECRGRTAKGQGIALIGVGVAALHVQQTRSPGEADAAGHRTERTLVVGIHEPAGEDPLLLLPSQLYCPSTPATQLEANK